MVDDTPAPALSPATVVVHAGRPPHEPDQPLNAPITMASTYVAGGDLEYGRYANPTWTGFQDALGELEGGRCLAFASGLAAVATVLDLVGQDGLVVAPRHAYLGCVMQLADLESRGRLRVSLVDIADTDAVIAACADAALLWIESPTNPALDVADIEPLAAAAHEAGASVVVDNTFATPLLQRPLDLGADIVVHSATKFLAGHSDVADRRPGHPRRPGVRRPQGAAGPGRRHPRDARVVAGAARPAHPAPASRARAGQRRRAGAPVGRPPRRSARCATPASARSSRSCWPRARSPPTC